jgi:ribosome assembly protein YihI (activator of Der GTPase)
LGDVVERIHQKWGDANSIVGQQQAKRNDPKPKVGKKKPIELVEAEPVSVNRVHETI